VTEPPPARLAAEEERELLRLATEARGRAYAPFSRFQVGAAVLTETGRFVQGCNVENSSYGLAVCAERVAILSAVAAEGPTMRLQALAVTCGDEPCVPCGACRQVMAEFGPHALVYLMDPGGSRVMRVAELLPLPFRLGAETPPG
jgi:cytidine deaminase